MVDFTRKWMKYRSGDLQPGEEVLHSVVGQPDGSAWASLNRNASLGRAASEMVKDRTTDPGDDDALARQIALKNSYVTLTTQRLLLHPTTFLGKPREPSAVFDLSDVANFGASSAGLRDRNFEVHFRDGSSLRFHCLANQDPSQMAARLAELRDPRSET